MADLTFNTTAGETVKRELLIAFLNTAPQSEPVWFPLGKRVEESSAEYDWGAETKTDVLGRSYTNLKKPTVTQTFEPGELDSSDEAQVKIWNLAVREQNYVALANQDILIVHFYAGSKDSPFAERYSACTVQPTALGGEGGGNVGMPVDITYGGVRTIGTATNTDGVVTFTPAD